MPPPLSTTRPEVDARTWEDDVDIKKKHARKPSSLFAVLGLSYSALGVIYGDIGTSPLYTVSSIFANRDQPDEDDIYMVICLIFWTITLIVLCKYVLVVLHANDKGEGGTFALYTHLCRTLGISPFGTLQNAERDQLKQLARRPPTLAREAIQVTRAHGQRASPRSRAHHNQSWTAEAANTATIQSHKPKDGDQHVTHSRPNKWYNKGHIPAEPIKQWFRSSVIAQRSLLSVSIVATSMVFGDGVLTPAVSVVSAVSGLEVAVDSISNSAITGISCAVLIFLFAFQYKGTAGIASVFSPIILLWLGCNAAIGIYNLNRYGGDIFKALSPHYIVRYFERYGSDGWMMLGSVMLCVTGAEAMFADLGHFDIPSIITSFVGCVYPCLVLTYFGQGAYLLHNPQNYVTAYWSCVPNSVFWPMFVLATASSVVASQALISACFSICKQAKALGFCPKIRIRHTSTESDGQIYISSVNWILLVLTVAVTAGFKANGTRLGQAYGLTISSVMLITTFLTTLMMVTAWKLSFPLVLTFFVLFALVDGAFVSANLTKVPTGSWVAIAITFVFAFIFFTWWAGQRRKRKAIRFNGLTPQDMFTFTTVGARVQLKTIESGGPWDKSGSPLLEPIAPTGSIKSASSATTHPRGAQEGAPVADDPYMRITLSAGGIAPNAPGSQQQPKPSNAGPLGEGVEETLDASSPRGAHHMHVDVIDFPLVSGPGPVAEASESALASTCSAQVPNREDLGLLRGEFNLALKMTGASSKPLATLPGIALLYSTHADIVPPVMMHFLRNFEAVHQINIFICVRHLPIPSIDVEDRLLVRAVPGLPNFYQAVVRYGYLDYVDHGKDFVNVLITALIHLLEDRAGFKQTPDVVEALYDPTIASPTGPGPVAEGIMDLSSPSQTGPSRFFSGNRDNLGSMPEDRSVRNSRRPGEVRINMPTSSHNHPLQIPFQPPRLALDLNKLSRLVGSTSLGRAMSTMSTPQQASGGQNAGLETATSITGMEQLMEIAGSLHKGETKYPPVLEDAALRVAHLLEAAEQGVVYYFGRTSLRMKPNSSWVTSVMFENIYKTMLLLADSETEAWKVPVNNLVELGMVVYI